MRQFSPRVSGYQNCCSYSGIYHQNSLKHLTFSVLLMEPFMNIGEFAASHGKKLLWGDLTSLSDRSLGLGEPSSYSDLGSKYEPVGFHSFICFRFCVMVDCRVGLGNIKCEHRFPLMCVSVFVVTWYFPGLVKHNRSLLQFWSWSAGYFNMLCEFVDVSNDMV